MRSARGSRAGQAAGARLGILLLALGPPAAAAAQVVRPGEERPELPAYPPAQAPEPALELPPAPVPEGKARERLSAGLRVFVREYRVVGSTVFSPEELAAAIAPHAGHEVGSEELLEVRDAITRLYIERGYVSSGAVIPDQSVRDGVIEIRVIEGVLAEVSVEGTQHLRESYIRKRLLAASPGPVHVPSLEERLQLLQRDERIRSVQAELRPGEVRGESFLFVRVEEESPYEYELSISNDRSPSVGSTGGRLQLAHHSLTGNGDLIEGWLDGSEGVAEWDARYAFPLNARDTTLGLHARRSRTELVEEDLEELEIESDTTTYGVELRHPLRRTRASDLWLGLTGELRRGETFLAGERFAFSEACEDGRCKLAVLRALFEWTERSPSQVLALRSTLSFGFDAFGASTSFPHGPSVCTADPNACKADATFAAWLGQFQLARRFSERYARSQVILRLDAQLAQDPLLPLEQYALGGFYTVRGYRENQLVRDNALVASAELRIPILRAAPGRDLLELAPFVDFGRGWNEPGVPDDSPRTLASAGLGLRASPYQRLHIALYWGGRLRHVSREGDHDLQDTGIHFSVAFGND